MVRLLVRDQVWRLRGAWLACGGLVATVWVSVADGAFDATFPMALSLLLVAAGLFASLAQLTTKELIVLPVSRRQRAQACWIMGIAIPVAVTSTARAVALLVAPLVTSTSPLRVETLILSTLCDTAFLGIIGGLLLLFTRPPSGVPSVATRAIEVVSGVAFLVAVCGGEFLLRPYLPIRWTDLSGLSGAIVIFGITLAAGGYFYAQRPGSRVFGRRGRGVGARTAATSPIRPVARRTPGAVSLLKIILGNCAMNALLFATLLLLLPNDVFSPQHPPANRAQELSARGAPVLFWFIMAFGLARQVWRPRLPQLRTLPLATWHLNAICLATAAAIWLGMWGTAALLHVAFHARAAGVLRPDLIAGLIGVSALSDAYSLQSHWAVRGSLIALGVVMMFTVVRYIGETPGNLWPQSFLFGAGAVAAAAWLNHRALTRSNSIYKPEKSALSFAS